MSFSELLFTFQPFPRPRFRMIVCPIIPFALPRATLTLTRPVARMLATLVFPLSRFPANLINTRAYRALARGSTFIAMFSHALENNMGVLPFDY
ncbi:MAG: hypothetical protein SO102_01510 [Eubacteriales bacterium]|nr:hypothetical protein [Eubacteriales bacterium]